MTGGALAVWLVVFGVAVLPPPLFVARPAEALPVLAVVAGGAVVILLWIARASRPLALGCVWAALSLRPLSERGLQAFVALLGAILLYCAARELSEQASRRVAWGLLGLTVVHTAVGLPNLWGASLGTTVTGGFPAGLMLNSNYWGMFLALTLPLTWELFERRLPRPGFLAVVAVHIGCVVVSHSKGAVLVAIVLLLALLPAWRWPLTAAGLAALTAVAWGNLGDIRGVHSGGRLFMWAASLRESSPWGWGVGAWQTWALTRAPAGVYPEALGEPVQLYCELGVVGLGLVAWWALPLLRTAIGHATSPVSPLRPWALIVLAGAVGSLVTPMFHVPALALVVLFAAARLAPAR